MEANEILEGNRIIAEFMGKSFSSGTINDFKKRKELPAYIQSKIRYDKDWKMLMEVVLRIESTSPMLLMIEGYACTLEDATAPTSFIPQKFHCNTKIEAVYLACLSFIKWQGK